MLRDDFRSDRWIDVAGHSAGHGSFGLRRVQNKLLNSVEYAIRALVFKYGGEYAPGSALPHL